MTPVKPKRDAAELVFKALFDEPGPKRCLAFTYWFDNEGMKPVILRAIARALSSPRQKKRKA